MTDEMDKKAPRRKPAPKRPTASKTPRARKSSRSSSGEGRSDEGVGYRRPPVSGQFKKGQSGNPKGRPKRPKTLGQAYIVALNQRVQVTEGGKLVTKAMYEVIAQRAVTDAANGKRGALKELSQQLAQLHASGQLENPEENKKRSDLTAKVMAELQAGLQAKMLLDLHLLYQPELPAAFLLRFDKRARGPAETALLEQRAASEPELGLQIYERRQQGLPEEDEEDF